MKKLSELILVWSVSLPVSADVMPLEVREAQDRLYANPMVYDRVDDFCKGKKPGASCLITGTTFSGGGEGMCTNLVNRSQSPITIDLSCVRISETRIDRKLPSDGFVVDMDLCQKEEKECKFGKKVSDGTECRIHWNCKPVTPTPSDQFCKGRAIGSPCTVELTYRSNDELHAGVCTEVVETANFYYDRRRTATRQVIRCEPPPMAARTYTPVNWHQKLFP